MPQYDDNTTIGGEDEIFPATRWTQIIALNVSEESKKAYIINELLKRYWKPVYCYLRHKGHNNETSKDLTQGFFHEIVLGRNLISKADFNKGRFRTLLLTALDRYIIDLNRFESANKRTPKGKIFRLNEEDISNIPTVMPENTAEQDFNYAWISELLNQILEEVENECMNTGKNIHWNIFAEKVLDPILKHTSPPPIEELCARYSIDNEKKASNMIVTVKRRLRKSLERHLRKFSCKDSEVEQEINEMLSVFSK